MCLRSQVNVHRDKCDVRHSRNLFLMDSTLSSSRPLVLPRSSSLTNMTSSVVEKKRTKDDLQTLDTLALVVSKGERGSYGFIKLDSLVHLSGETVNEESTLSSGPVVRQ